MSTITKIAAVETTSAIWEFDLSLPDNRVLGNSLDVVAAVRTLAIKVCPLIFLLCAHADIRIQIQCSGQCIKYFHSLQINCGITIPLSILLHSNIRWGTADGMLGQAFQLRQPINLFISSTDKLFGPITTIQRNGCIVCHIPWMAFIFKQSDWDRVNDACIIISVCGFYVHFELY